MMGRKIKMVFGILFILIFVIAMSGPAPAMAPLDEKPANPELAAGAGGGTPPTVTTPVISTDGVDPNGTPVISVQPSTSKEGQPKVIVVPEGQN